MSLEGLKAIDQKGRKGAFLQKIVEDAEKDLKIPYLDPTVDFEGRSPVHLKHENVSHDMAEGLSNRFARSSLLYLKTGEERYKRLVLDQIEALYDTTLWPHWCDKAHMGKEPFVDIRTYRISMWVALAYNWLYDDLSVEDQECLLGGFFQLLEVPDLKVTFKVVINEPEELYRSNPLGRRAGNGTSRKRDDYAGWT